MASILLVAYLFLILSVLVLSFFYVYILSRRFKRYAETKPQYFPLSIVSGMLAAIFLTISATLRPEALALGSKVSLTYMHALGNIMMLLMITFIYKMTSDMVSVLKGKKAPFSWIKFLFFSISIFTVYYTASLELYTPVDGLIISVNFMTAIDTVILLTICLMSLLEISRRIAIRCEAYIYPLFFFASYHFFYQLHAFLTKVMPIVLPPGYTEIMSLARLIFTVIPAILVLALSFKFMRSLMKTHDTRNVEGQKDLILFLDAVSQLIGESTMTIYQYGVENYRKIYPVENGNDELYRYIVNHFGNYIGPVSTRIAEDIENKKR